MAFPAFFEAVPGIDVHDPLAYFLGASDDGILHYGYADAVRLAGHSCPTVASAYWMTRLELRALYREKMPERGGIRVDFSADLSHGVTGVIVSVVSMLTGAAGIGGFKGLAGKFGRKNLLAFGADIPLELRYTRLDGEGCVDVAVNLAAVPSDPETSILMQRCLAGVANDEDLLRFQTLWQDRVRRILMDHGDDASVFTLRRSA